jgi:hypothetical protein
LLNYALVLAAGADTEVSEAWSRSCSYGREKSPSIDEMR